MPSAPARGDTGTRPDALDLCEQARSAVAVGRFAVARRLLARAARLDPTADTRVRLAVVGLYLDAETDRPDEALRAGWQLLDTVADDISTETVGRLWSQLALLLTITGDHVNAIKASLEAETRLDAAPELRCRVLINRGNLHLQRGDVPAAIADLALGAELAAETGMEVDRAKTEHNLGYALMLAGDLIGALRRMESAGAVLNPISEVLHAVDEQDRAEVLLAAGRPTEAAHALEAAATAYGSRRLRRMQADCELALARTLQRDQPQQARGVARRAARRFRAGGRELPALRADALALRAEVATGSRRRALVDELTDLAEVLRRHRHRHEAALLEMDAARMEIRLGRLEQAMERLRRTRPRSGERIELQLARYEVRAAAATAADQGGRARRHVRAGLAALHDWQSSFGSLDLQSSLVGHGRDLAIAGMESALADGDPALVYEWAERTRALTNRVAPVLPPNDPELAADLTELRLAGEDASRRDELVRRIRDRSWYGSGGGGVTEPAVLEQVRAALADDHAALLGPIRVRGSLATLVLTEAGARVLPGPSTGDLQRMLGRLVADLDMAATEMSGPFAESIKGSLDDGLRKMSEQLITPALDLIGDRRVVLTPSGSLSGTPWGMLEGMRGRPLTVAPSATRWLQLRGAGAVEGRVALVAGPGVPRGDEEVLRAAGHWTSPTVILGRDADSTQVAKAVTDCRLLHLAGHGRHSHENPLFSAVQLADGPWFGYDIDQLPLIPELVVLSACELGRFSTRSGEETIGMTAAWLHAGARSVVSSPALVADDVACEVLARWHQLIAAGRDPAEALAIAGEELPSDGAPSPFLCFGGGW